MEPKFVTRQAFTVVGLKYCGKNEQGEISQLWRQLMARFAEIKTRVKSHGSYGVMGNFDQESGEFEYLAGFEVESPGEIPEGMAKWSIPDQTYAVFPTTLPSLMSTFDAINQRWLPDSGYQRGEGPEFELYDETFDPQEATSQFYLYIPVVRKR